MVMFRIPKIMMVVLCGGFLAFYTNINLRRKQFAGYNGLRHCVSGLCLFGMFFLMPYNALNSICFALRTLVVSLVSNYAFLGISIFLLCLCSFYCVHNVCNYKKINAISQGD